MRQVLGIMAVFLVGCAVWIALGAGSSAEADLTTALERDGVSVPSMQCEEDGEDYVCRGRVETSDGISIRNVWDVSYVGDTMRYEPRR